MPLKCSTASYQFRCHDGAYLFSAVVDFISSFIFVMCQGKLRFEVSFIVFGGVCKRARIVKIATLSDGIHWKFSQLDDSDGVRTGHKSKQKSRRVLESTLHAYHVGLLCFLCFDVSFMQRKWFSPTIVSKQKENSCNFFISARDNGPRPEERPEKRIRSCN